MREIQEYQEKQFTFKKIDLSYGHIYRFTNLLNGKMYHGQTTRENREREQEHLKVTKRGSHLYFHNALRKYGIKNFKNEILCYCGNAFSLALMEDLCINLFSLYPKGYNLMKGGIIHKKWSEKEKEKQSEKMKKTLNMPEIKEKIKEKLKKIAQIKKKCRHCGKECANDGGRGTHEKYCKKNLNRTIEKCRYCGEIYTHLRIHEKYCEKNLNRTIEKCKYCGKECANAGGRGTHEKYCKKNPNRIIKKCQYCGEIYTYLKNHENHCEKNLNRIIKKCQYCGENYTYLKNHKIYCKKKKNNILNI